MSSCIHETPDTSIDDAFFVSLGIAQRAKKEESMSNTTQQEKGKMNKNVWY